MATEAVIVTKKAVEINVHYEWIDINLTLVSLDSIYELHSEMLTINMNGYEPISYKISTDIIYEYMYYDSFGNSK